MRRRPKAGDACTEIRTILFLAPQRVLSCLPSVGFVMKVVSDESGFDESGFLMKVVF